MKATIIAYLGRDAELKYTQTAKAVVSFSVADTVGWGDKQKTQWVRCTLWGERGEKLLNYLIKGQQVVIFGEVSINEYQNKDGVTKTSLECHVDDIKLVGKKKDDAGETKSSASDKPLEPSQQDFIDDDIPF